MALALGLTDVRPLEADPAEPIDKWVVFVPDADADAVAAAMHGAGAGTIGDYDSAQFQSTGTGSFRPLDGADPTIGEVGSVEQVAETRIEMVADRRAARSRTRRDARAHPYEEVAYDVLEPAAKASDRGSGRIGTLAADDDLADFASQVTEWLPAHHSATRVAGDPERPITHGRALRRFGRLPAGPADAAGADVYVTSDLRHHPVSEHLERPGSVRCHRRPALGGGVDLAPGRRCGPERRLPGIEVRVSTMVTDPWTSHVS